MTDKHEDYAHGRAIMLAVFILAVGYFLTEPALYVASGVLAVVKVILNFLKFL